MHKLERSFLYEKFNELLIITRDFLFTIFSNTYGINISMLDYMKLNNFSHETINHIDGFCRSFDGGDSSSISLNEFINSSIQSLLYSIYIPKIPINTPDNILLSLA